MDSVDKRILGIVATTSLLIMVAALLLLRSQALERHENRTPTNTLVGPSVGLEKPQVAVADATVGD